MGDSLPEGSYTVHSRFQRVVNLVNENNDIVSITSYQNHLTASSILILPDIVDVINYLLISKDSIQIDSIVHPMEALTQYLSKVTFCISETDYFKQFILEIPQKHETLFPENSMIFLLLPHRTPNLTGSFNQLFALKAQKASELLIEGKIMEGVSMLKGAGAGLTPAGDDFIAGVIWGLHFNEFISGKDLNDLRNTIFQVAQSKNLLVNTFFRHAISGNYFFLLKNFIHLARNREMAYQALEELIGLGATSGADLLSGYIFCVKHKLGI